MNRFDSPGGAATMSSGRFVQAIVASGLLTMSEIEACLAGTATSAWSNPGQLGRELIRQGKLTHYQVAMLLQDKWKGLVLHSYILLERLGAGGMGVVFKAEHHRMKRIVALKILAPAVVRSRNAVQRFQREVEAAAQLSHPNIVAAYDADEIDGTHFLVLEYVAGSDLSRLVQKNGPLAAAQAVDCILQAARGLDHAHARSIVHRDVKPSNLLLDGHGTVKVLDMGLARLADSAHESPAHTELTRSGLVMGTSGFMAPEQAVNSHAVDARADIYSLGCTLYYLVTGRPPYQGGTALETLLAHREQPIPPLGKGRPDVSAALEVIYRRMVAKLPTQRYQSMREVIDALEGLNRKSLLARWRRRLAVVGAVLAVALLTTAALFKRGDADHPVQPTPASFAQGAPTAQRSQGTTESPVARPALATAAKPVPKQDVRPDRSAAEQAVQVLAKLRALNPGFDGQGTYRVEEGAVVSLVFSTDEVEDIAPLAELRKLYYLRCAGSGLNRGKLRSLQPLRGLRLTDLVCCHNPRLDDLSPLAGMPLETLDCVNTAVNNLSVLAGMPLTLLHCSETPVRDLTPLRHTPLRQLRFPLHPSQDVSVLRSIKSLRTINSLDVAEFFRRYDAK
jgi:tRNA A-37 threonylcarbamoyl transferase component Bud32